MQTVQLGMGWFDEDSGGLNRYYVDLVRRLPGAGVGVTGLVTGSDAVTARSNGVVRSFAPTEASLPARLSAARTSTRTALRAAKDQLLVTHFALYAAPCLDLVDARRLVVHFHGPWADESRVEGAGRLSARFKHWVEHLVYGRADRLIVLSRAFARLLEKSHSIAAERIHVVPGGVDARRFATGLERHAARRQLGWPTDRPIALVVRRLTRRMGLETLVDSLAEARRIVPDLLVLIAGKGPLERELRERILATKLQAHVRLVGFVPDDDLPTAYRAADLSVVPSVALEGFGLVVAESLAAGTPVLVTGVGGLPETLEGFAPQCVVPAGDAHALGRAIGHAAKGDTRLPSTRECMTHAQQQFDWSVVIERVRRAYAANVA